MTECHTSSYKIQYFKELPKSSIADYDYDGFGGRYPCEYYNHLLFYDNIIDCTPVCKITLGDDAISDIKTAITDVCDNFMVDNNNVLQSAVHFDTVTIDISVPDAEHQLYISVSRENIQNIGDRILIRFEFTGSIAKSLFCIVLDQREAEYFYQLLDDVDGYAANEQIRFGRF